MGTVKDLEIIKTPNPNAMGIGRFHFSDRYSVFDWGEMPDHIGSKGKALCTMGAYFFEELEKKSIETHYRGLVDESGKVVSLEELKAPSKIMEFSLTNVYEPQKRLIKGKISYDYNFYTPRLKNFLIPLEIIYRNGLPQGSSVFKRLSDGIITIEDLGLTHKPKPGERLSQPIFDVSTKLEETDRYITWAEARKIAGLTRVELSKIKAVLSKVNSLISEVAINIGLKNQDGKIELAFDEQRKLMVVDVVGTLDECRFNYKGIPISKEIIRKFYRTTEWYKDVEKTKRAAEAKGVGDWRQMIRSHPRRLSPKLKKIISEIYMAVANGLTKRKLFDSPELVEVISNYERYLGEMNDN